MKTTVEQFNQDVIDISTRLVQAFGLAFGVPPGEPTELTLYRWMDYRLRHISAKPREVRKSGKFLGLSIPSDIQTALTDIESRFKNGDDVNPFLSKTVVRNDVSDSREANRTDGLWADWKIHHFHLTVTPLVANQPFSERSGWLLFAMVYESVVAFIDVRQHSEADLWSQDDLVKTFIDSWPQQAEPFRVTGMKLESRPMTPEDYKMMRAEGIVVPVEHNGEHYMPPGGGVTTAITSTAVTQAALSVKASARTVAKTLDLADNPCRLLVQAEGVADPRFELGLSEQGLCIVENTVREMSWLLPRAAHAQHGGVDAESDLHNRLLPEWAVAPLLAHWRANP